MTISKSFSVGNKPNEFVSVLDFPGVDPTGATDSTAGIQAAIDYVSDFTIDSTFTQNYSAAEYSTTMGKCLYFPAGTYIINSELLIKGIIQIKGDGPFQTVIKKGASFSSTYNAMLVISREVEADELWILGGNFEGFKLDGDDQSAYGIYQVRHHFYEFKNIVVTGCLRGCYNKGGYTGKYDACHFIKNNVGFRAELYDPAGPIYEEPNNIDFISCVSLENSQGWNLGGATNFNFIGGLTQGHTNEALTTNGTVGAINFDGHYFEDNGSLGAHQIETPFAVRTMSITNGQISTAQHFLDAEELLELHIEGNNILGDNTVVYISAASTLRHLEYRNNPRIYSTTMVDYIIDNNKANFTPECLHWNDFASSTGGTYSTINQIKKAFNGSKGTFKFLEDVDTGLTIDFPCTITASNKHTGISRATFDAVTVLSDDVDFVDMKIATTGGYFAVKVGNGVSAYKGIRAKNCYFVTGSRALGPFEAQVLTEFVSLVDCEFERLNSNGRCITIDGDKSMVMNAINRGATYTIELVFAANSTNCRWALVDGTVVDLGTGNSSF